MGNIDEQEKLVKDEFREKKCFCPIYKKYALTIEEASEYFNIGQKTLIKALTDYYDEDNSYLLQVGKKRLIKRVAFEKYLDKIQNL